MLKSALPLVLASSPLLLAAARPPVLESIDSYCVLETNDWSLDRQSSLVINFDATAQPIASPDGAFVNSQQEMSLFSNANWPPALHLLLDNPYILNQPAISSVESTSGQNHCIPSKALHRDASIGIQAPARLSDRLAADAENPHTITPTNEEPTPFDGSVVITLESLPDGNYRYLAGTTENRTYTNAELRQHSGSLFVLTKVGSTVTGDLLPRFGLPGICVTGTVTDNTISGAAYPYDTTDSLQDSARDIGETFEPHGSGALQIRRTRTNENGVYYAGARLDLNNFTLINAGSSLPPTACVVGQTGGRDQR